LHIRSLYIQHFRNISEQSLSFSEKINLFYGNNGAGKTALLEAIYYLASGRSFRVNVNKKMVQQQAESAIIRVKLEKNDLEHIIGVELTSAGSRKLHIDGEKTRRLSLVAQLLPVLAINAFNMRFFIEGPTLRRKFLDWGAFHYYPEYSSIWRQFNKAWQQRNMALKKGLANDQISCWDNEFVETAEMIDKMRRKYVDELNRLLLPTLQDFLQEKNLRLEYKKGWDAEASLEAILKQTFFEDCQSGYTQCGPHRADLNLYVGDALAQDYLSQGQQKIAAYAFYLSQGRLFAQQHGYAPIFLIDDLPAELDVDKRSLVAQTLNELKAQIFITGVSRNDLEPFLGHGNCPAFHVKHGVVAQEED